MHQFFTETRLDKTTQLHFQSKNKTILSRSVTYCHDLPGLIAFKKLVENLDDDDEVIYSTQFVIDFCLKKSIAGIH